MGTWQSRRAWSAREARPGSSTVLGQDIPALGASSSPKLSARGIPACPELPGQPGSAAQGALQTWAALGNAAGPGSGRKIPWGWAGGGAEPEATHPHSPGCLIPGWDCTALPASQLCRVKDEVLGAACRTWSTPEMGTVGHPGGTGTVGHPGGMGTVGHPGGTGTEWLVMDLSAASLPPSQPTSQKHPAAALPPFKTPHEENHLAGVWARAVPPESQIQGRDIKGSIARM